MKHVTAYYIDARDGRPATEAPLRHGPAKPSDSLNIDAVDRRQEPALIIGRIPSDEPLSVGMTQISEQQHTDLLADYQAWRDANAARELEKQQAQMSEQSRDEFQAALERGFQFDGGTFIATGPRRTRVTELVVAINSGKGLPQGKTSMTFRDANGGTHDFNESQIVDLGAAGSDMVDAAEDRLEQLISQIIAATSHADLDAIDTNAGWPS